MLTCPNGEHSTEEWQEKADVAAGLAPLAWDDVLAEGQDLSSGENLVIHEFAHQLDLLDGFTN